MNKFKVGDRVRRTFPSDEGLVVGEVYTVSRSCLSGVGLHIEGHTRNFSVRYFELVEAAPAPIVGKATNPKDAIGDTKVPLWLLSPIAKAKWALAQFAGLCKYGAWNWRVAGVRSSVYLSAMQRHIDAYSSGEELDPVDGTDHLANIMACCAILIDAKAAGKLNDDRPPSVGLRDVYAEVQAQMAVLKVQYKDMEPRHYTIADTAC
jgi:hypothetical protein